MKFSTTLPFSTLGIGKANILGRHHDQSPRFSLSLGASALFAYVGTPSCLAVMPQAIKARIPFVAPFTGAMALRTPFNANVFHIRASYNDETALIVRQLDNLGVKRIAVFLPK